jgi:hypothetical protein
MIVLSRTLVGFSSTHTTLTTIDSSLTILFNKFISLTNVIVVSEESSAAALALMKWKFNANAADLVIRKISDQVKGARLQIVHLLHTYTVDVIQISFGGLNSMYQIKFIDQLGAITTYNIIVHGKGGQTFEVSILNG